MYPGKKLSKNLNKKKQPKINDNNYQIKIGRKNTVYSMYLKKK